MYNFRDKWIINSPLEKTWEVISNSADWQRWWPGLTSAIVTNHHPDIIGSSVQLAWRSKSGYHLRHKVTITAIEPKNSISFRSSGDLAGQGTWRFKKHNNQTHMIIDWHVYTTKAWMNILSPILRPMFIKNHTVLMRSGESGLNNYFQSI